MTNILEQGIDAVRVLPPEKQDIAGELLLRVAAFDTTPRPFPTAAQVAAIQEGVRQADAGQFAGDEDMAAVWHYCGV